MKLIQLMMFRPVVYSENQFKLSNSARGGNAGAINIKWLAYVTVIVQ
jgi:hypothetical protein